MSGASNILGSGAGHYDPKTLLLLDKLIDKTRQAKLYWAKATNKDNPDFGGFVAVVFVPGTTEQSMTITFTTNGMLVSPVWLTFSVKTTNDGVILNVQNALVPNIIAKMAGIKTGPLREKIDELFRLVADRGEGTLERALKALDSL